MKAVKKKRSGVRLMRELGPQKGKLIFVLFASAVSAVIGVIYPLLMAQAIEEIIGERRFVGGMSMLAVLLLSLAGLFLLRGLFGYLQQYVMSDVSQKLAMDLRKRVSAKLNRLPLRYFDSTQKGEILSRVNNDIEKMADTLQESLSGLLSSSVAMVGALGALLWLNPPLALVVFGTVIVSFLAVGALSGVTERRQADNQAALGRLNGQIEESFTAASVVKAFGLQKIMAEKARRLNDDLCRTGKNAQFITYLVNPIIQLLNHLGYVVVAFGSARLVLKGVISVAYIPAFFQYTNKASEAIMSLAFTVNSLQGAVAAAGRVYELLDQPEEAPDREGAALAAVSGAVRFEHVRFGYREDAILMEDIDLDVSSGSKVAIVGPTGAGKTTLVNLLMRFYEVLGGEIRVDGTDIRDLPRAALRRSVGMVLQDTWLFEGTIADNIAYGRPDAAREEIVSAARAARCDHFIRTLPQGYDTVLSEETASLSAGQRQLLTIARALLADPAILILDEATSSVDTHTERELQRAMDTLMEGRTCFIIAHRLSTIRDAQRILVMDHGSIIEQGSHDALMAQNGFYTELYNAQFAGQGVEN